MFFVLFYLMQLMLMFDEIYFKWVGCSGQIYLSYLMVRIDLGKILLDVIVLQLYMDILIEKFVKWVFIISMLIC